jgi:hypothetical protein
VNNPEATSSATTITGREAGAGGGPPTFPEPAALPISPG